MPAIATEEEVDDFIDQNIQINSNKQMRVEYLHSWTLKFKDATQETKYCQLREDMFRSNMLCVFIVWIFIVLCQTIIIPRCTVLVICLTISTILLTCGCILVMAEEFSSLPIILQKSSATLVHHRDRRTLFICAVIILMSVASSIGLFLCPMAQNQLIAHSNSTPSIQPPLLGPEANQDTENRSHLHISEIIHRNASNDLKSGSANSSKLQRFSSRELNSIGNEVRKKIVNNSSKQDYDDIELFSGDQNDTLPIADNNNAPPIVIMDSACSHPEYLVFTWVLCLIALATGLKLYYLVKVCVSSVMVCCYAILILIVFPDVFANASTESDENLKYGMPLSARMNILLTVFLTMVTYHARLVEVTSRLDFIWKEQAEKELSNMKSNRILNDLLIKVQCFFGFYQLTTIN